MTRTASFGGKLMSVLLSLVLVAGLLPVFSPAKAYAEGEDEYGFLSELEVGYINSSWLLDFDPDVHEYTVMVPRGETQVFVKIVLSADAPAGSTAKLKYANIYSGNNATSRINAGMYRAFSLPVDGGNYEFAVEVGVEGNVQEYIVHIERCDPYVFNLDRDELTLAPGETAKLSAVFPEDFPFNQVVSWGTENEAIAKVDGIGQITGVSEGTASVYAVYGNNMKAYCSVTVAEKVEPGYLSDLSVKISNCDQELVASFDPATRSYRITVPASESTLKIKATVSGDAPEGSGMTLKYVNGQTGSESTRPLSSGSAASVAVLSKGDAGSTFSVLVGSGDDTQEYEVVVDRCEAPVITLAETEIIVPVGGTHQLSASLQEGYPLASAGVTWTSNSRTNILIDENGVLTAVAGKKGGTYTVTAKHGSVSAKITVITVPECEASVSLAQVPENLKVGDQFTVSVTATAWDMAAMEATISYDETKFRLVSVTKGSGLSESASFQPEEGKAEAFFSFYNNEADAKRGIEVAVATFEVLGVGDNMVISLVDDGIMAKTADSSEIAVVVRDIAEVSAIADALLGDANNSGKINIVDAQVVYDMATGKYGEGYAQFPLPETWNMATLLWVANVNGDDAIDASDAFAIQRYVHYGTFGE